MSLLKSCPTCGLTTRPGPLARHTRSRHQVVTVDELVAAGNVDTSGGDNACWMWSRGTDKYGVYRGDRAHRQMFRAAHGPIPDSADICHTCDTPGCVNPRHLWAGSRSENIADAVSKGRVTSPMLDANVRARVAAKMPRGDEHYTRTSPAVAQKRVKSMLAARGIEYTPTA